MSLDELSNKSRIALLEKQLDDLRAFVSEQALALEAERIKTRQLDKYHDVEFAAINRRLVTLNDQVMELRKAVYEQNGQAPEKETVKASWDWFVDWLGRFAEAGFTDAKDVRKTWREVWDDATKDKK